MTSSAIATTRHGGAFVERQKGPLVLVYGGEDENEALAGELALDG